jgi:hypothetical protein
MSTDGNETVIVLVIIVLVIIVLVIIFNRSSQKTVPGKPQEVIERALTHTTGYNFHRPSSYNYRFNNWYSGRWNYTPTFYYNWSQPWVGTNHNWYQNGYPYVYNTWSQPSQYVVTQPVQQDWCYDYLGNVIQCQYTYRDIPESTPLEKDTEVINIVIKAKDNTHKYYKQGDSLGYVINGVQSPDLKLKRNKKYRFIVHGDKMYLTNNPASINGQNGVSTNVSTENESPSQSLQPLRYLFEIVFDDKFPNSFYYDSAHKQYMGGKITLE